MSTIASGAALAAAAVTAMASGPAGAAELSVWHGLTGPDGRFIARMADEFGRTSGSGDTARVTVYHWDAFFDKWVAACAAGSPPDVVILHTSEVPQFSEMGVMEPIAPYLAPAGIELADFAPAPLAHCRHRGILYALPLDTHPMGLYIHADLAREAGLDPGRPPRTGEDLLAWARKLTVRGADGRTTRYGISMPATNVMTFRIWYGLIHQRGGRFLSDGGGRCLAASPEAREALQWCLDLVEKERVAPPSQQDPDKDFVTKKVAMTFQGPWWITGFIENKLDFVSAPVPTVFGRAAVWASSHVLALSTRKDEARKRSAAAFVQWMTAHSAAWAASGQIPASRRVLASRAFTGQPLYRHQKAFVDQLSDVVYTPAHPRHNELFAENVMTPVVSNLQAAMLSALSPAQALAEMAKGVDAILARP